MLASKLSTLSTITATCFSSKSLKKMSDNDNENNNNKKKVEFLSLGSIVLDCLVGGGLKKNSVTLLSGQDHHEKNLLAI